MQTVEHPVSGTVRFIAQPICFDDRPPAASLQPPMRGQQTSEVLSEWLGWSAHNTDEFAAAGAFGTADPLKKLAE